MPSNGMPSTPELATATSNLERALEDFRRALRAAGLPRSEGPVFAALRQWRTQQAREQQVPPYVIATDAVLRAIEEARPTDLTQLRAVRGVSEAKARQYGEHILRVVAGAADAQLADAPA